MCCMLLMNLMCGNLQSRMHVATNVLNRCICTRTNEAAK